MANLNDVEVLKLWQSSPIYFVRDMWGLVPIPIGGEFVKGKNITNHQYELLTAVERAVNKKASPRISVRAGKGVGKSCVLAWVLLWYLFCFKDAQIPCTAPTGDQLFDVLWKEAASWLSKMPEQIKAQYEWQSTYIRIVDSPATWFARARTAKKESPEALAGIHADHVACLIDESSGVPDNIFKMAEGSLTGPNTLMIMISNPTRIEGYFYDSHHSDKEAWQCLHFNGEDSPVVDEAYIQRVIDKWGRESDEYKVEVLGEFPKQDVIDKRGFVPLLLEHDIQTTTDDKFVGKLRMGVDPAGVGVDQSVWVIRDRFKAKIVARENISTAKGIAQKTLTLMDFYEIPADRVVVDSFGVGAQAIQEIALAGENVLGINVGDKAEDEERYHNLRAEAYYRIREWARKGGEFVANDGWKELLWIKYKRDLRNRIQIMSKDIMRGDGIASPGVADGLMLTFCEGEDDYYSVTEKEENEKDFNPFSIV